MSEMVERMNAVLLKGKLSDPAFAFGDEAAEHWWTEHHRVALQAALDETIIRPMIEAKIKTHYWNHHGARDPSPEFVDDLAGMICISLRKAAGQESET